MCGTKTAALWSSPPGVGLHTTGPRRRPRHGSGWRACGHAWSTDWSSAMVTPTPSGRSARRSWRSYALREARSSAVVTRNGYGSLVLNADRAMFVDVDLPRASFASRFGAWLGVARHRPEAETLARLKTVLASVSGSSFRIYRTAAGFRVLAT